MAANTTTPVRAGCYHRISSDPKNKREGVDRQREDTSVLCEAKGWTPVGDYTDNDRSASNGEARPEWDRLLADIKAGKIDAIAAWSLDRGWRMMSELETLRKFFAEIDRPILLATNRQGDIDLNSPSGVLIAQMNTSFNEHDIAQMKVRMRRAAKQKAQRGKPQWKRAFGYLRDTYELNPETAPWVQKVYAHVLAGGSISDGARMLNEAGALAERWEWPRDENGDRGAEMECIRSPWSPSTLSLFLRSPRNAGLRAHNDAVVTDANGQPVKGTWPALVDETTWYAAQDVLNAPGRAPGRKSVRRHKLTGLMRCGKCGDGRLNGKWAAPRHGSTDAGHEIVYSCANAKCRGCAIRADDVEPLLYQIVSERLGRDDAMDLLVSKAHDSAEAERIRTEKNALAESDARAEDDYKNDLITGVLYAAKIKRNQEKRDELNRLGQDQERLRVLDGLPLGEPNKIEEALRSLSPDRFRAVVHLLLEITVLPVGRGSHNRTFNPDRVRNGLMWKV